MHLAHYLNLLHAGQAALAAAFESVGSTHGDEPDVQMECEMFAAQTNRHAARVAAFARRYGEDGSQDRLQSAPFGGPRSGGLGLLRDLHDLYLMATECEICWTMIGQAARGLRDEELIAAVEECDGETKGQIAWLRTRLKQSAPQALVVAN